MVTEMAYLLGMITGNGVIQRRDTDTNIIIDIPHKKLQTEFNNDVTVYVRASIVDIKGILEPLLGTSLKFTQDKTKSYLSFRKPNDDYIMREIMGYIGYSSSSESMRISPRVYDFTFDERKHFIKGFADVTGYIRRSNYYFTEPQYRVYFEIPRNWDLVVDFANLLKSVDIPVQSIDWAHPNMRDGNLKKYNEGKFDFWKKEHQIKVWAIEYQSIGFAVIHKQEALDYFAKAHRDYIENEKHQNTIDVTHRYYWEGVCRSRNKPHHPGESDYFLPNKIWGKHYNSWTEIANDLGYNMDS